MLLEADSALPNLALPAQFILGPACVMHLHSAVFGPGPQHSAVALQAGYTVF